MNVGSSERFEIELEPHAPKRSRFRHRSDPAGQGATPTPTPSSEGFTPPSGGDVVFTPPAPPEQSDGSGERNRLVVTALAVGAVALFFGWSLGRAGGGGGDSDGDAAAQTGGTTATTVDDPEATTADTSATATTVPTGDTLPEASLPSTTRPRPTTTTTLPPEWEESQVQIDGRLDGQADRIVAVTDDRGLIDLDLATGTMRSLDHTRPRGGSALPPIAGDDWIALAFDDGNAPVVYRDGEPAGRTMSISDPWSLLWQPADDVFWQQRWDQTGRSEGLVEYGLDGSPTGRSIETRGLWVGRTDFTGGFLIGDGSIGAYRITPDGSQRLADGYILAAGTNHLLTYACAENFDTCAVSVVERSTGQSTVVPIDDAMVGTLLSGFWQQPTTPSINSTGTAAIVAVPDVNGPPNAAVLDFAVGDIVWEPSADGFGYVSGGWSADGRFAYMASDDTVLAYDHVTGEAFDVAVGDALTGVVSLTLRPA